MGFIMEIGLTIAAWRRGWKWWALIPVAVAFFTGFFGGMVIGLFGGTVETVMPFGVILDVVCIVALIIMVIKHPDRVKKTATEGSAMPVYTTGRTRY